MKKTILTLGIIAAMFSCKKEEIEPIIQTQEIVITDTVVVVDTVEVDPVVSLNPPHNTNDIFIDLPIGSNEYFININDYYSDMDGDSIFISYLKEECSCYVADSAFVYPDNPSITFLSETECGSVRLSDDKQYLIYKAPVVWSWWEYPIWSSLSGSEGRIGISFSISDGYHTKEGYGSIKLSE